MTITMHEPPAASTPREPAAPVPPPPSAPAPPAATPPPRRPDSPVIVLALQVPGIALSILAAVTLGFVVHLTVISQLQYQRNQQTAFADFRAELARGTAPVGQTRLEFTDGAEEGTERLAEPGSAVAVLEIPAVGLRTVVFEGTRGDVLQKGPGHRRDSVLPGQAGTAVVMGRRAAYGGPFRDLDLLLPGDRITATTGQGTHEYRVRGLRYPGEPAPPPLTEGKGRITLVTADGSPFVPQDLVRVDADLVSTVQPTPPASSTPRRSRPRRPRWPLTRARGRRLCSGLRRCSSPLWRSLTCAPAGAVGRLGSSVHPSCSPWGWPSPTRPRVSCPTSSSDSPERIVPWPSSTTRP
ncbi:sortase [Phytohabitans flavus]|uniref:sortase n=1 Tax=Phytohabitans flavus TaxID=1076124 RepID=UPI0036294A66